MNKVLDSINAHQPNVRMFKTRLEALDHALRIIEDKKKPEQVDSNGKLAQA